MLKDKVVLAVRMTPTGDNSQPFTIDWNTDHAIIHHNDELARHRLNVNNIASMISLGCLLENVRVAALSEGMGIDYTLDKTNPLSSFKITFHKLNHSASDLLKAIELRCSDRRNFSGGYTPELAKELSNVSVNYQAQLKIFQKLPDKIYKFALKCDSIFWEDTRIFFDTVSWVRFSKEEALRTKDGLTAANLGLNPITKFFFWLTTRNTVTQKIFKILGLKAQGKVILKNQLNSAAGVVFFYPPERSLLGLVETGKLAQRVWLELTQRDYAAQPFTLPTLLPFANHTNLGNKDFDPEITELLNTGAQLMNDELNLPAWGLRFGKVDKPFPDSARTYRR